MPLAGALLSLRSWSFKTLKSFILMSSSCRSFGFPGLADHDLSEHLPKDDFDVLVVDADALAPVNTLDFIQQITDCGFEARHFHQSLGEDVAVQVKLITGS